MNAGSANLNPKFLSSALCLDAFVSHAVRDALMLQGPLARWRGTSTRYFVACLLAVPPPFRGSERHAVLPKAIGVGVDATNPLWTE